ncbi:glutamate racemase [Maribacter hydrothermalis]|uniref:Glutamate racemase n=1 Tax=Maribacter hydrothermalis TaxID=1836467 RepID=A0A1B7ZDL0_9FLAO|nr:glutamate racemase [Maribacter hydrothermalis]APQ16657.1 glutamate racemase [Maribacter hydrothermalis]OBR41438.1 glutamate racemase [Maribacter hydrothermalis]
MDKRPIGIFDSGIGGSSIWGEIEELLPNENCIYLADSKNAPYGEKPKEQIVKFSVKNTEFLLSQGCKIIVVACNTATTNAIDFLRTSYEVPFIGIEPALKPAAINSKSKIVGVLATKGTLSSSLFHSTTKNHAAGITVLEQSGTGLVELIESGNLESAELYQLLESYIMPMLDKGMDYLVLGCTHYPYLIPILKKMLPSNVMIIDSGQAVARQTKMVLDKNNLLNMSPEQGIHQFYTNGDKKILEAILKNVTANNTVSLKDF